MDEEDTLEELQQAYSRWNWAAFLLPIPWMIGHGMYRQVIWFCFPMVLCQWIVFLPPLIRFAVGFVLLFIASLYLGRKGNEFGWENRDFRTVEEFRKVQSVWSKWAVGLFIVQTLIWGQFVHDLLKIKAPPALSRSTSPTEKAYRLQSEQMRRAREAQNATEDDKGETKYLGRFAGSASSQ
jgi:hypothetical protein